MIIEYIGHSAFNIISENGVNILIDPFIRDNPSASVSVDSLNPDVILVTHGHYDHFGDTIEIAKKSKAIVISSYGLAPFIQENGVNAIGINKGGSINITPSIKIKMVKAEHSSEIDFMNTSHSGGFAAGFIINLENDKKIYHAGDTALFGDMKNVIGDIYKPDISLIPIGDTFTMGIRDASIAAKWLQSDIVIPMHYNTFENLRQDTNLFESLVKEESPNTKIVILKPGERFEE